MGTAGFPGSASVGGLDPGEADRQAAVQTGIEVMAQGEAARRVGRALCLSTQRASPAAEAAALATGASSGPVRHCIEASSRLVSALQPSWTETVVGTAVVSFRSWKAMTELTDVRLTSGEDSEKGGRTRKNIRQKHKEKVAAQHAEEFASRAGSRGASRSPTRRFSAANWNSQ